MVTSFVLRLSELAQSWFDAASAASAQGHRALMKRIATVVALRALVPSEDDGARLATASDLAAQLAALQGADGLFSSDGNLHSPPDSAFTLNDLGVTLGVIDRLDDPALAQLRERLVSIATAAAPALVTGGVHTPNHRWEISAALARLAAFDDRALERARQWLAEGIDVDADGIYSERSANYAAHVSNPSLLALAEVLDRPDLVEIVHANLHTYLTLTDADGVVETVFSRRQDHNKTMPLEIFHLQLRRFALGGCVTCAAGAARCEPTAEAASRLAAIDAVAVNALLEVAAEPGLGDDLPGAPAEPAAAHRLFAGVGLLVRERDGVRSVVSGGSDVPHVGRVGSGLAANPTFLRFRSGSAVIRSLRLSRVFFGLGPFRADALTVADDGATHLHERVAARYYQPLPAAARRDGDYRLESDGRFSASMAFSEREHDEVELVTDVVVSPDGGGLAIHVTAGGASTRWALELALGEGELTGVERVGEETYRMVGQRAELRNGSDAVVIATTAQPEPELTGFYEPGEAYAFLGGTDALDGPRLYLTGTTPGTFTLTLHPLS